MKNYRTFEEVNKEIKLRRKIENARKMGLAL